MNWLDRVPDKEWTREDVIELLNSGNGIICYDCPDEVKNGDNYIFIDGKVYCTECGESEDT